MPSCPWKKNRYHADEMFLLVALTALYTMAENQPENQHLILAGMHGCVCPRRRVVPLV